MSNRRNTYVSVLYFILCILFFSCGVSCLNKSFKYSRKELKSGVRILKKYDFQKGGYTLVGLYWKFEHDILKGIREFYVEDIATLEKIKREWVFYEKSALYECGYHYTIKILKDGEIIENFNINLEEGCNAIVTSRGALVFEQSKLEKFRNNLKPLLIIHKIFASVEDGRKYITESRKSKNYLYEQEPIWEHFSGFFYFEIEEPCTEYFRTKNNVDILQKDFSRTFGENNFILTAEHLSVRPGNDKGRICTHTYKVTSDRELFDKFRQYEIIEPWKEFSPIEWVHWQKVN